jgi:hypothetical protein
MEENSKGTHVIVERFLEKLEDLETSRWLQSLLSDCKGKLKTVETSKKTQAIVERLWKIEDCNQTVNHGYC